MKFWKNFAFVLMMLLSFNSGAIETHCEEIVEIVGLNTIIKNLGSGQRLLDFSLIKKEVEISYPYKLRQTTGHITLSSTADKARFVREIPKEGSILCKDRLEVDAVLTFISQDKAFVEQWPTKIKTYGGNIAKFDIPFLLKELNGSFYMDGDKKNDTWKLYGIIRENGNIHIEVYSIENKQVKFMFVLKKFIGAIIKT